MRQYLGRAGTYLGYVVGAYRHKDAGINPFGPLSAGAFALGGAILLLGAIAVLGTVLWVLTAIYGRPPHFPR